MFKERGGEMTTFQGETKPNNTQNPDSNNLTSTTSEMQGSPIPTPRDEQDALFYLPETPATVSDETAVVQNKEVASSIPVTTLAETATRMQIYPTAPPVDSHSKRRWIPLAAAGTVAAAVLGTMLAVNSSKSSETNSAVPLVPVAPENTIGAPLVPGVVTDQSTAIIESSTITLETPAATVAPVPVNPTIQTVETNVASEAAMPTKFEQTLSVEEMSAMSIEEFATLDYGNRAAFFYVSLPNLYPATPQEAFDPTIIPGFYWQAVVVSSLGIDPTLAAKYRSVFYYKTADNETGEMTDQYKETVDAAIEGGVNNGAADSVFVYRSNSEIQTGTFEEYENVEFTELSYATKQQSTQQILLEQTAQVFQITTTLKDGREIVTYPIGYQSSN